MHCSRVDSLLSAYLAGELPSLVIQQVSDHLTECKRCRAEQASYERASRALDAGRYTPSIDLWADFSRRLQQQAAPRPSPWRQLWQPGLASALAALVVGLVVQSAPPPAPWPAPEPTEPVQMAALPAAAGPKPVTVQVPPRPAERGSVRHAAASVRQSPRRAPRVRPRLIAATSRPERERRIRLVSASSVRHPVADSRGRLAERKPDVKRTPGVVLLAMNRPPADLAARSVRPVESTAPSFVEAARSPTDVVEALATAQQDAASAQVEDELLRFAQAVARVSGEFTSDARPVDAAGT